MRPTLRFLTALISAGFASLTCVAKAQTTPHPILFVTVFPIQNDFATIGAVFGTHPPGPSSAGRGGDLWIRYPNGALRNITREAGLGVATANQSGPLSIAVRDASVHWSASRAVFSLVKGTPARWQMYEVTGPGLLDPQGALSVSRVAGQPADYNNIEPTYASDGSLIFTSDRPRNGAAHLYPQQDEYESTATVTGLWKLDATGQVSLLNHSPSGAFNPLVDSFGRVVFTRWDHMERDQQEGPDTFNWVSESAGSATISSAGTDVYPEHKFNPLPNQNTHSFNFFLPWEIHQDGTKEEVLNHMGRHELANFFFRRLTNDSRLVDYASADPVRIDDDGGLLHIAENPRAPGCFYATDAPEFGYHAGGRLMRWCSPPSVNPEDVAFAQVTADNTGSYRDPLVLDTPDLRVIASHTSAQNIVSSRDEVADPNYRFRLKLLVDAGNGKLKAGATPLTDDATMRRTVNFGTFVFDGPLWEFSPVEVRVRPAPPAPAFALEAPERAAFTQAGVDPETFRAFLRDRGLGLIVVRDATARDDADRQQPFNLRVPGGRTTLERNAAGQVVPGTIYDLAWLQLFQADQIRGYFNPSRGRRPIAQHLHDPAAMAQNPHAAADPAASVPIESDGSAVVVVPARRAMTWQTLSPAKVPVVLERYWVTLQPGEIRACDGCHGVNKMNQARQPVSTQTASALVSYLQRWRQENGDVIFRNGFQP